jgi:UDP-2-acetamido-3-amino-2,3-dideoxy-glucuronate N-acetyltransferase
MNEALSGCLQNSNRNLYEHTIGQIFMSDIYIHPTAIVSDDASIGEGTKIWHHCHVREYAQIGRACILGKGVYIDTYVVIGDECKIQNYACLYRGVTLENRVFVGPHVTFTNDMYPRSWLWDQDQSRKTDVKEGASIGANATVVCGTTIGRYSMVGAGAVVTRDVPDHGLVVGNPGNLKGYVCVCGHPLEGTGPHLVCPVCNQSIKVER